MFLFCNICAFCLKVDKHMVRVTLIPLLTGLATGHNSLVIPVPRNAIDGTVPAMINGGTVPGGLTCTCADDKSCPMGDARHVGGAGQPCLWWSQGCSIGCPYCLTDPEHPDNGGKIPTKEITGNPPHADKAGFRKSYCDNPTTASVLPKEYWTMNVHAIEGAVNDSYRFNPWRAPGEHAQKLSSVCVITRTIFVAHSKRLCPCG